MAQYIGSTAIFPSRAATGHHDDVIKRKHFPRYWPFVRGIHWSPVTFPHKGQWRGDLMFSLICFWINDWENNREAGDYRRYRAHHDVIVMTTSTTVPRHINNHLDVYMRQFPPQGGAWHHRRKLKVTSCGRKCTTNKPEPGSAHDRRHIMTSPGYTGISRRDMQTSAPNVSDFAPRWLL